MLQHVVVHDLVFHFLEFVGVVVVAVLDAGGLAAAAYFIEIVAVNLEIVDAGLEAHPGRYDVLHAGGLVHLDALVPPGQGSREVSAGKLFRGETAGYVGAEHLHSGGFHLLLEHLGGVSVDETLVSVIAGCFHGGVTHSGDGLQDFGIIVVIKDTAGRVHLDAHILLDGSRFLGGAGRESHHGSKGEENNTPFHISPSV